MMEIGSAKRPHVGMVVGAIALLLTLTLPFLGRHGLWTDEIFSVTAAASWQGLFEVFARFENNMALYYILLCGWMTLGDGEVTVRLLSTIIAVLTVPVLHLLAVRLFDRRVALIADFMLVANAMFLTHAREARSYSLLVLLSTAGTLLFLAALRGRRWSLWVAYACCMAAGVYAHYFAALVVAGHALALAWPGRPEIPWRQGLVAGGLLALLLLPLLLFPPAATGQVDWIPPFAVHDLWSMAMEFTGGRSTCLAYLFFIALGLWSWFRPGAAAGRSQRWSLWLVLSWLVAPIVITIVVSLLLKPMFVPKFLIEALPALIILTAVGIARLPDRWAALVVAGFIAALVVNYARRGIDQYEPWREIAQHVQAHAENGDAVICYPFYIARSFTFYAGRQGEGPGSLVPSPIAAGPYHPGGGSFDPPPDVELIRQVARQHQRVWVILSDENEQALHRAGRPQIESAMAESCPQRTVIRMQAPLSNASFEVILYSRAPQAARADPVPAEGRALQP